LKNSFCARYKVSIPIRPCSVTTNSVAVEKLVVGVAISVTCTSHTDIFEQTQIFDLMVHHFIIEIICAFVLVWLDATNIMRMALLQSAHKSVDRFFDLLTSSRRSALVSSCHGLRKERLYQRRVGTVGEIDQVIEKKVTIAVTKAFNVIGHISSIVADHKRACLECRIKVFVIWESLHKFGQKLIVGAFSKIASVVQKSENADGFFEFDQVTANFVVEKLNVFPFDAFSAIFFLFGFECELNENLLELFIYIIDAKLFKPVSLQCQKELSRDFVTSKISKP
jgi:hypothetical protein